MRLETKMRPLYSLKATTFYKSLLNLPGTIDTSKRLSKTNVTATRQIVSPIIQASILTMESKDTKLKKIKSTRMRSSKLTITCWGRRIQIRNLSYLMKVWVTLVTKDNLTTRLAPISNQKKTSKTLSWLKTFLMKNKNPKIMFKGRWAGKVLKVVKLTAVPQGALPSVHKTII